MDLQFHKTMYPCLQRVKWEVQNQEQTQEVRLTDGMPDIGRVLGAWGQVLMRGKEWRSGGMSVSGGVMVWVMYAPEDGSEPRSMETWIPFQIKWEFADPGRDGTIGAACLLRSVDARSISARKLMVRVGVGCLGEAMVPGEVAMYTPGEIPEDIQLLKNTYPVQMPREAGEKPFFMDEMLSVPAERPRPEKVLRYTLNPEIVDKKVIAGKVVFRGNANIHMLYRGEDGGLYFWDQELPFSQYSELEGDYEQDAAANVMPAVTSLEMDMTEDGQLHLKAGLTGQYVIYDRSSLELVEDAYSPHRSVTLQTEELVLPAVLDTQSRTVQAEAAVDAEGSRVADVAFYPDHIRQMRIEDAVELSMNCQFQMLYYDMEQRLQSAVSRWEESWTLPTDRDNQLLTAVWPNGVPQATLDGRSAAMRGSMQAEVVTTADRGMPMVVGLTLGQLNEKEEERPSLILRKAGSDSLWQVAKSCGSTVEAISRINGLQGAPDADQMLLIPVV